MISTMRSNERKAKVTPETVEESVRLRAIWDSTTKKPSQTIFGEMYEVGSQSAVATFLKGTTPISLKAAKGFARGLGCKISDFSPRLAALETAWPFELVDRDLYESLPTALQHKAQVRMQDVLEEIESQALKANGTNIY